jgi:esterase/lipase superfamily enzyme
MHLKSTAAAILIVISVALAGCGSRPGPEVLTTVSAIPDNADQVKVYAVTTRSRVTPDSNVFDAGKATVANYAEFTVSIPPNHKPAQIEWPKGRKANPAKDFAVTGQSVLSAASFHDTIHPGKSPKRVGIFVHGYNYNFQESLFRLAQISHDAKLDRTPILFSWPSQAAVAGYVADKESATYSRDYLAALLIEAAEGRGEGDVAVFGHSMGGWLVVETLRQLKLQGRDDVLSKLSIILAAPDIDEDVFRTQMAVIGTMKQPMTILVSGDDRALAVSKVISASSNRVGTLDVNDPKVQQAAIANNVTLVDISQVQPSDSAHHNRFFDAAGATISSPFRLVSGALKQ